MTGRNEEPRIEQLDGVPVQMGMPESCAAVVISMIQDLIEGTEGDMPVRAVIDGRKYLVSAVDLVGDEILLRCEP